MAAELLTVSHLGKVYAARRWWGRGPVKTVLRDVSLTLARGGTLALVGPSGSGKSTLARCIAGFEDPTSGEILRRTTARERRDRTRVQLIFQQPAATLNPRFTAAAIIEEPLLIQRRNPGGAAARALELVGLPPNALAKRALHFSGGERQRLAIARALVLEQQLLILDESFSGLDPRSPGADRGPSPRTAAATRTGLPADLARSGIRGRDGPNVGRNEGRQHRGTGSGGRDAEAPRHELTRELIDSARALSLNGWGGEDGRTPCRHEVHARPPAARNRSADRDFDRLVSVGRSGPRRLLQRPAGGSAGVGADGGCAARPAPPGPAAGGALRGVGSLGCARRVRLLAGVPHCGRPADSRAHPGHTVVDGKRRPAGLAAGAAGRHFSRGAPRPLAGWRADTVGDSLAVPELLLAIVLLAAAVRTWLPAGVCTRPAGNR